jgi:predicted oxidoreductase
MKKIMLSQEKKTLSSKVLCNMKIKDKTQNPQSFYFHLSLLTGKIYKKIMACQKADIMDESFYFTS